MSEGGIELTSADRVLVLAPHPDDETIATGGLLQRAAACGAETRVVFATDGENNPWPQRVLESRWRIETSARSRWGARRRREALAALAALNIPARHAAFLGLPDQGLTMLLLTAPERAAALLAAEMTAWEPTVVAVPSGRDRHPDHSALAVLTRLALSQIAFDARRLLVVHYLVHRPASLNEGNRARDRSLRLRLSDDEKRRKISAIERHATQLLFHRRSFTRIAASDESFLPLAAPIALDPSHPIRYAVVRGKALVLELASRRLRVPPPTVVILTTWAPRTALRRSIGNHRDDRSECDPSVLASAFRLRVRTNGEIVLPIATERQVAAVFVKLERRFGWFDDDGWREIPIPGRASSPAVACTPLPVDDAVDSRPRVHAGDRARRHDDAAW